MAIANSITVILGLTEYASETSSPVIGAPTQEARHKVLSQKSDTNIRGQPPPQRSKFQLYSVLQACEFL